MQSEQPKISIVIPNYNNEKYLLDSLHSVLKQDYPNLEVVIVDDCSTDSSREIIQRIAASDSRVKPLYKTINQGVVLARHDGIIASCGMLISTLDSDDIYITSRKISKEFDCMNQKYINANDKVIAYSGIQLIDKNSQKIATMKGACIEGRGFTQFLGRSCLIPRDFLMSKSLYFEVGGFDTSIPLYEDWDLKLRLAKIAHFHYSNDRGIGYRQHLNGLSTTSRARHLYWLVYVFLKNFEWRWLSSYIRALPLFSLFFVKSIIKSLLRR